jgi:hypothetical protein
MNAFKHFQTQQWKKYKNYAKLSIHLKVKVYDD